MTIPYVVAAAVILLIVYSVQGPRAAAVALLALGALYAGLVALVSEVMF